MILIFLGGSPDAHDAELEAWARARLVQIQLPDADGPSSGRYAPQIAQQIEEHLEAARLLVATLDGAGARARLGQAERLLRDHPELPQAAWLMAERWELEASAAEREPDGAARAAELRRRRAALEGDRAETYAPEAPRAEPASDPAPQRVVRGLRSGDRLFWNGLERPPKLEIRTGEHHVRVLRLGRALWSGWVRVEADAPNVTLPIPKASACSLDDLSPTRISKERVIAPASAQCARWAVARPAIGGGIEIASCSGSRCGPLLLWKKSYGAIYDGPPQPERRSTWPTWATVGLVGVGAVVIGGVVAWRAGAFDEPEPKGPSWRFYGP